MNEYTTILDDLIDQLKIHREHLVNRGDPLSAQIIADGVNAIWTLREENKRLEWELKHARAATQRQDTVDIDITALANRLDAEL